MTIIELMVVIVITAILFAIGVPFFRDASLGARLSAAANNLVGSVQLARSEAIKRNTAVTLCASSDGATCAGTGGWEQGWIVHDSTAVVLQREQALPTGYTVTQTGGTLPLSFQPIGIGATAGTFTVCRDSPVGTQERVVTVSATGATYVTRTETATCP